MKFGNPGAVGLGAFGFTTLVLQFHNLGWCGTGPVLVSALIFGGLTQLIAGLQEMRTATVSGTPHLPLMVASGFLWRCCFSVISLAS